MQAHLPKRSKAELEVRLSKAKRVNQIMLENFPDDKETIKQLNNKIAELEKWIKDYDKY